MPRVMIAGTHSGCGKTTIVCGILQAFMNRGMKLSSFKCGPDYIDPMFHSEIIGVKSRNLDGYFMDRHTLQKLLHQNGKDSDISIIEGVMGYYDGVSMTEEASSYQVARFTNTPVILVVNCKGMSLSIQAMIEGYLNFKPDSGIKGVIFNGLPSSLYEQMRKFCEKKGVKALGFFPYVKEASIESRHLGLVTAGEITDLREKMELLATNCETYLDLDGILDIAKSCEELETEEAIPTKCYEEILRIAVARDKAFCFYYEDNLELLRSLGCELIPFSPLKDEKLPENIDGLILGGGYPELYGKELMANTTLLTDIHDKVMAGLPTYAECGGYMYLHKGFTDLEGNYYKMTGVLDGTCKFTNHLQHFGYTAMTANQDSILCKAGTTVKAHEFHRCVSDLEENAFHSKKNENKWKSGVCQNSVLAGFPHIHFYENIELAKNLVQAWGEFHAQNR